MITMNGFACGCEHTDYGLAQELKLCRKHKRKVNSLEYALRIVKQDNNPALDRFVFSGDSDKQ